MESARTSPQVDYDQIAPTYDRRYQDSDLPGVARALGEIVRQDNPETVLEAGCGTGRWLADLREPARRAFGLDRSLGMLRQAQQRDPRLNLANGRAEALPFEDACFDLVYCVNALHHFERQRTFLQEARRVLKPSGRLAVIGLNPHRSRERWYVYQYFDGTYAADLQRFPRWDTLMSWMVEAGFAALEQRTVERIYHLHRGVDVFNDPFLKKESTSQLVLLSDQAYADGLAGLRQVIADAEARNEEIIFTVDNEIEMVFGRVDG